MLVHLGYVSTETRCLNAEEKFILLQNAQENNTCLDVTGILIHRDDSFFQVIEGEREVIRTLYEKIRIDPRHKRVEKLFEEEIAEREFSRWSMTMRNLDDDLLKDIPDFAAVQPEALRIDTLFRELPKAKQLLRAFRSMP